MDDENCMTILESIRGEIKLMRAELEHTRALSEERLTRMEKLIDDHETRLRDVSVGVTQFRFWSSIGSAGSTAMSLLAMIKSLGG